MSIIICSYCTIDNKRICGGLLDQDAGRRSSLQGFSLGRYNGAKHYNLRPTVQQQSKEQGQKQQEVESDKQPLQKDPNHIYETDTHVCPAARRSGLESLAAD
ncbi:hypothetical protein QTP88_024731 [Uroleucon formosanum]